MVEIEKAKVIKFQSRVFTVPKRDSPEGRWILDLSKLNAFIKCPKFRMLTMRDVRLLLPKGFWTVALDLKDGFWHLPVSRKKRPFLGFRYRGQLWQFRAMPFGLNVAPRVMTIILRKVLGLDAVIEAATSSYIDDILVNTSVIPAEQVIGHLERN